MMLKILAVLPGKRLIILILVILWQTLFLQENMNLEYPFVVPEME